MPVSYDKTAARDAINNLSFRPSSKSTGTNIVELLSEANMTLANYDKRYPDDEKIVFIFSDGENAFNYNQEGSGTASRDLPDGLFMKADGGAVLGYGGKTQSAVPKIEDDTWMSFLKKDETKEEENTETKTEAKKQYLYQSYSKIDEEYLKQIADKYGFSYTHRDNDGTFVSDLKLKLSEKVDSNQSKQIASRIDIYWILALAMLVLLLWEFYDSMNMVLAEREKKK